MPWSSFLNVLDQLIKALEGDTSLVAFCKDTLGRSLTVRKALTRREEVLLTALPIVMITVPSQSSEYVAIGGRIERSYTVRLYCGFQEKDRVKAVENLIRFEEYIEQAILNNQTLEDMVDNITIGDSGNDEGGYHPVYFLVKNFTIEIEQDT